MADELSDSGGRAALRLTVIGDSLTFIDNRQPQPPDEPTLFPNVAARALSEQLEREVATCVLARAGWGVREAWQALTKDRHIMYGVVPASDALILALGSFDHLPAGVPPWIEAAVPQIATPPIRRRVRRLLHTVHPHGVAVTRGRFARVPGREFARLYDQVLEKLHEMTDGAPIVALGPAGHDAAIYAHLNPHLKRGSAIQAEIAARHGVPFVPSWPLASPHVARFNADGVHWPADVHAAVGAALAEPLAARLRGEPVSPTHSPAREGVEAARRSRVGDGSAAALG